VGVLFISFFLFFLLFPALRCFVLSSPPPPGTIGRAGGATCDENKSFQRRSRFPQESPRRNGGKELGGKVEHDGGGILKMKQKEEEWEELR